MAEGRPDLPPGVCPLYLVGRSVAGLYRAAEVGDLEAVRRLLVRDHGLAPAEAAAWTRALRGVPAEAVATVLEQRLRLRRPPPEVGR